MNPILSFFLAGPAAPLRLKALLIGGAAVLVAGMALLVWGLYWRGEYREAKAAVTVYAGQAAVNAAAANACTASVAQAEKVGSAVLTATAKLLAAARADGQHRARTATALEDLARRPRAPGENCDWAWDQIEQQHRKARTSP